MLDKLYYMQDSRQYVGNSMYWWAKDAKGYTCDIRKAHVFTTAEAIEHTQRESDVLWPKDYIDARISHHIDTQSCYQAAGGAVTMDRLHPAQRVPEYSPTTEGTK